MSDERQLARQMSSAELRAIVAGGLHGKSRTEIAHFANELGITLAELRELVASSVPSAEQVAQLIERVPEGTGETLRKLRERTTLWRRNAAEIGNAEAGLRLGDLLTAIAVRLAALRPPPPPQRCPAPVGPPPTWVSPPSTVRTEASSVVELPTVARPVHLVNGGDGAPAPRMPRGDGFDWLR
jgi:hypothetical protein